MFSLSDFDHIQRTGLYDEEICHCTLKNMISVHCNYIIFLSEEVYNKQVSDKADAI